MSADSLVGLLTRAAALESGASSDYDLNPGLGPPAGTKFRPAGVLVTVMLHDATILLTKRSSMLKHHPGQVACPGGKVDPEDRGVVDAALREAEEEVGLARSSVRVLGTLPSHLTVTAFEVTPVLAIADAPFTPVPETGEVTEAFFVPFAHVMTPENYRVESRRWRGMPRYYYAVPWGPYYIWGATARILRGLAERVAQCS